MVKITVIEDDETDFYLLSRAIDRSRFEAKLTRFDEGTTGLQDILSRAPSDLPDAVLVDLGLPGLSGEELLLELKSQKHLKNVPTFVFSGLPQSLEVQKIVKKCDCGLIDKACEIEDIEKLFRAITKQTTS